ncbi:hypothetical protein CEXT_43691 [Caerostris extrusa]|uniref:Uncharacterized protein n=1 Tax=Caerostris extrusa TaxID=172846 RepID=A0AAV4UWY3_CAEEX|nr:hypothetical protein CEXT_43691 [Caerostris extrusa]
MTLHYELLLVLQAKKIQQDSFLTKKDEIGWVVEWTELCLWNKHLFLKWVVEMQLFALTGGPREKLPFSHKTNIYEVPDKRPPRCPINRPLPCSESGRYRVPDEWWAQMVRSSTDPSPAVYFQNTFLPEWRGLGRKVCRVLKGRERVSIS